jgi:hypothetical protein
MGEFRVGFHEFGGECKIAGGDGLEDVGFGSLRAECGGGGGEEKGASSACHAAIVFVRAAQSKTGAVKFGLAANCCLFYGLRGDISAMDGRKSR